MVVALAARQVALWVAEWDDSLVGELADGLAERKVRGEDDVMAEP